jgi:hypothetical protein
MNGVYTKYLTRLLHILFIGLYSLAIFYILPYILGFIMQEDLKMKNRHIDLFPKTV